MSNALKAEYVRLKKAQAERFRDEEQRHSMGLVYVGLGYQSYTGRPKELYRGFDGVMYVKLALGQYVPYVKQEHRV